MVGEYQFFIITFSFGTPDAKNYGWISQELYGVFQAGEGKLPASSQAVASLGGLLRTCQNTPTSIYFFVNQDSRFKRWEPAKNYRESILKYLEFNTQAFILSIFNIYVPRVYSDKH